ncbi:hypothetical protein PMIN06_010235 [Paraphaeosphaeria minitans]
MNQVQITGEGAPNTNDYYDISDFAEGSLIDSCFRGLREHMGFSRNSIRPDVAHLYPPSILTTAQLSYVHYVNRNGWEFRPRDGHFLKLTNHGWEDNTFTVPTGLSEVTQAFPSSRILN